MPAIDGGPQNSEDYSPHLYRNGKYVGNQESKVGEAIWGNKIPTGQQPEPTEDKTETTKDTP